jgi:hypothetical protein
VSCPSAVFGCGDRGYHGDMGKHSMRYDHARARSAITCAATAAGAICLALTGAGTAHANTHHGVGAPGNPFGAPRATPPATGTQSAFNGSFTTVRITRSAGAPHVSGSATTSGGSSGGALSSALGKATTGNTSTLSTGGGRTTSPAGQSAGGLKTAARDTAAVTNGAGSSSTGTPKGASGSAR